ncbi:hypothetical protein TW65_03085 [Stemphylium lycopersici]|uniref:Uncharacterized protein n=1 Tax=Stemphylium lycopersici TaxID=183478 RepID=A0A364NB67_STELY|nr:hypothetical protein TW65_03085 [Stemphylium lycopersici]RAR14423.1 hypothetical protein DDE83_002191 [Stemphylium lycopersici]
MDDLFEGYMVVDGIGDFLDDPTLINQTKHPAIAPRPEQHAQQPKETLQPSTSDVNERNQVYPDIFKHARRNYVLSEVPSPRQVVRMSDTPTIYSADDMQLFHHYLIAAYPCIPHDFREIWIRDVPLQSHKYSYLMDAMLAIAGSHLSIQVENPKHQLALHHRQKAIVGLEDAFSRWPPTAEESHIMFAASYLLCFQSTYMEDAFFEHFLSLRGCSLLSQLIVAEGFGGPFVEQRNLDLIAMDTTFRDFPEIDQELLHEALLSLRRFSKVVARPEAHPIEKVIVGQLVEALRYLLHSDVPVECEEAATPDLTEATTLSETTPPSTSSSSLQSFKNPLLPANLSVVFSDIDWENITTAPPGAPLPLTSFVAMMAILTIFSTWPHDALVYIFDQGNHIGNVVMAHFCAIRFFLSPLTAPKIALRTPTKATVQWSARIMAAIDEDDESGEWAQYVEWPRKIQQCMQACVDKNRGFTMGDIRDMVTQDSDAFKEGRAPKQ